MSLKIKDFLELENYRFSSKKVISLLLMMMVVSIVACKPVQKEATQATQTGDAAVDAVGNDLNSVDAIDQDLNTDELGDIDSGLSDVGNI